MLSTFLTVPLTPKLSVESIVVTTDISPSPRLPFGTAYHRGSLYDLTSPRMNLEPVHRRGSCLSVGTVSHRGSFSVDKEDAMDEESELVFDREVEG